jgi:hypothetical protein
VRKSRNPARKPPQNHLTRPQNGCHQERKDKKEKAKSKKAKTSRASMRVVLGPLLALVVLLLASVIDAKRPASVLDKADEVFDRVDLDGDGELSSDEVQQMPKGKKLWEQHKMDGDSNGE